MPEAVIVATGRSPIGRATKGSLADVRPEDLLASVMKEVVAKSGVDPADIDDVITGSVGGAQINISRSAALLAGIPDTVPATTVNRYCSSSLQAIRMAFHAIKAGEGDTYLCGGSERSSRLDSEKGTVKSDAIPMFPNPVLQERWELFIPMGMTAENVADKYNVSREDMDRFAQRSQERAVAAQESGFFDREIVPFTKEDGTVVSKDDGPRASSTYEKLAELKPVFRPQGGRVTAGNSCPLNDGGAAVMVMSEDKATALGIKPIARIIASGVSGLDPRIMGVGPIEAVRKALEQANMKIDDVDVMELNEAFAAQVLPVCENVGVDPFSDKLNPHGGAIALGHPFGQTGARIMTTLLNDLQTLDKSVGLETMCVGGGQGLAMIVERV
ncbi:MAG TPA: acetyl-CoA C-acyltransferase [Actinomycetota bacterium]|jgi:acetyl-CoA C-acetyltransferase|nr:acetyl-CoA C-acyltransferase [Actinomycetota bacterium]